APLEVGSRALDVLRVLVERPDDLLSRHEIMAAAWPGMVVDDNNLTIQIATLRRILDRDRADGSCIQTVPGRGYRFVAPVKRVEPANPPPSEPHSDNGSIGNGQSGDTLAPGCNGGVSQLQLSPARRRFWSGVMAPVIGALALVAAVGAGIWHLPLLWDSRPAPRLSIVVLPFVNIGNDPEQQYFADGITEGVTTDLSHLPDMLVISRNSAFTYRSKSVDTRQIGRELGVRYVLDGSVQRSGNQVRVTALLIDAESDVHLWAERFDRDTGDLFALQNEITGRIATALNIELVAAEAVRPTDNPDALDYIFRGRAAGLRPNSRETHPERISMFEHALALDPRSVDAQSLLAQALAVRVLDGVQGFAAADLERADELIGRALAASPRSLLAHMAKGDVLRAQGRCEEAIPEYETALAINRNSAVALHVLADCEIKTGSIEEVVPLEERAIRLSPRDPRLGHFYFRIGHADLLKSRTGDAIRWLEKARNLVPELPFVHALLAAAYGLNGDTDRATAGLAEARRLQSGDRFSSIANVRRFPGGYAGHAPKVRALLDATYIAGLRKAGMPEE
ncbi:MAG: winged helix-turn-helix domain-containing protein, partial [Alphaproteobacteria bacterium]|nr:winged helix-turn-helix domain-containing protein [Alphaproteobacteria bacterium]